MNENQNTGFLFSEFPPVNYEEWKQKIKLDLKGIDFSMLHWHTFGDFDIPPFFLKEHLKPFKYINQGPGYFPFIKESGNNRWFISEDWDITDVKIDNKNILKAYASGTSEVCMSFTNKHSFTRKELGILFENLDLEKIRFVIKGDTENLSLLKKITPVLSGASVKGGLDYDPLGHLTRSGSFFHSKDKDLNLAKELFLFTEKHFPYFKVLSPGGYIFAESGASLTQELGFTMAMLSEYLSDLTNLGLSIMDLSKKISFSFGVGPNYFMEIAKIRAARLLWTAMLNSFDSDIDFIPSLFISSRPIHRNITRFDPYTNMLRYTTEVQSAALGGANSIHTLPFDTAVNSKGSEFSKRIARNTQIILQKEAYLEQVIDPGSGSYYIENLTKILAENAWNVFLSIEENGGYLRALEEGVIQEKIKQSREKRKKNVATRKEILLGTNHFPNQQDDDLGSSNPPIRTKVVSKHILEPIQPYRAAEKFEKVKLTLIKSGLDKSSVVLFPYGNPAICSARITFATNFLGCAGFKPIVQEPSENLENLIDTCKNMDPRIVVFCSSDTAYPEFIYKAINEIGSDTIYIVTGTPGENEMNYKKAGVRYFIHDSTNVLKTLQSLEQDLHLG